MAHTLTLLTRVRVRRVSLVSGPRVLLLHGQYVFNVFTLELNTHVNTRIHFGPPHSEYV